MAETTSNTATDLEVRIVRLEPMRMASFLGFGPNPEELAGDKRRAWMAANGMLNDLRSRRFLGFNNPSPSHGSPNYGYEEWVTLGADVKPGDGVETKDFPGGLYAVTRCQLKNITETWGKLVSWCGSSKYSSGRHQWLEELLSPEFFLTDLSLDPGEAVFDLYLPIRE